MTNAMYKRISWLAAALAGALALGACTSPLSTGPGSSPLGGDPVPTQLDLQDFSGLPDGTSLTDYGYTVDNNGTGSEAFVISSGVIESDAENGWFNFQTPEFAVDRTDAGGVGVEWEIRYPEALGEFDRESAKFYVKLLDDADVEVYTFLYKPYLRTGETAYNLEISNAGGSLLQVASRDIDPSFTPSGASAPWINFKWKLTSAGDIELLIDDVQFMAVADATYSEFSQLRFTYRTGSGSKAYTIQIRNLSVLPL
jgi:hypothetical protein